MIVGELVKYSDEDLKEIVSLSKLIPENVEPLFKVKPFIHLKYEDVIELKELAKENIISDEIIEKVSVLNNFNYSLKWLINTDLKRYFRTVNLIEDNFKRINEYEKLLFSETDSKLIGAGIENLNQFGDLNTIDALAGGDILKWELVLKLEWWDVFNKLYKTKIENDIRKNLEMQRELENKAKR